MAYLFEPGSLSPTAREGETGVPTVVGPLRKVRVSPAVATSNNLQL